MGTKTIDERLAAVLKFVCERENVDINTLKSTNGTINLFPKDLEDAKRIKETISYLKNYAKIREVSKLLVDQPSVRADIQEAKNHFEKLIEETKKEIEELPKAPRKRKDSTLLYGFSSSFEQIAIDEVQRAREERKNKLLELRANIALYRKEIKKLNELENIISDPKKVVEKLFSEESMKLKGEYGKLVNMCAVSIDKCDFDRLTSENERSIFDFDGDNYSINGSNARKFLSIIKSKKAIMAIADYANKNGQYKDKQTKYNEYKNAEKKYAHIQMIADSKEFSEINDRMNEITTLFGELVDAEDRAANNLPNRVTNFFRKIFNMEERVRFPKKLFIMKDDLADKMKSLLNYSNKNVKTKKAFNAYLAIRKNVGDGHLIMDEQHIDWAMQSIRRTGSYRVNFPTDSFSVEDLKLNAKMLETKSAERAKQIENGIEQDKNISDDAYNALPLRARKILETNTPEEILEYAKKYYPKEENVRAGSRNERKTEISPSAAALILESLIKKRDNISWEKLNEIYSDVLDKEQENLDLEEVMSKKVDFLRTGISQMVSNHPRKNILEKQAENNDIVIDQDDDREAI